MVVHSSSKPTATPWPALLPMGALAGKPPIPIARPATLVGSRQTAHLRLHSSQVSKAHALILSYDSRVHIRDLNSRTKVLVNGNEVREADLKEGDQVKIGRFTFRFTAGPRIQSTARRRALPAGQLETDAGDVIALDTRVVVIGQRAGCDLVISGESVSTTHAAIYDVNGRRYIMDLGSRSGTFVNNQKTIQVELKIGDVIDIGGTDVRYLAAPGAVAAPTRGSVISKPAVAAPAAAASADAELDELLALESLAEAPQPTKPSGQSKLFEPPASVPDDTNVPIPLEEELKLPEPEDVRERVEINAELPSEPEAQAPVPEKSAEDISAEKAAEDELMALLDEQPIEPAPKMEAEIEPEPEPEAEQEAEAIPVVEEPEMHVEEPVAPPQAVVEEEPIAVVEEEPIALVEDKPIAVVEEEPIAVVEEEPIAVVEASADPKAPLEVTPEPIVTEAEVTEAEPTEVEIAEAEVTEGEIVGTATANVQVVPEAVEEVAEEVKEAATAFGDELPTVQEETLPPALEPSAPPVVEETTQPETIPESDIDEMLEEEPQDLTQPKEEPVATAPTEAQTEAAAEAIAQVSVDEPEPIPVARPPRPRWVAAPGGPNQSFTPTLLTIKPHRPAADFDLDELLGEKKSPFAGGNSAPIQQPPVEAPAPPPIEIAPAAIEEEVSQLEEVSQSEEDSQPDISEAIAPPPVAEEETPLPVEPAPTPPPPVIEEPDLDDLALAALEEPARTEPASQPQPQIADVDVEALATIGTVEPVEPPPAPKPATAVATASTAILPEPPAPATTTSTTAPVDEDPLDLLEALPDEPESVSSAPAPSPGAPAPAAAAPAAPAPAASAPASATAPFPDVVTEPSAPDVFSLGQRQNQAPAAPAAPAFRGLGSPGRVPHRARTSAPIPPRWGPLPSAVVADMVPPPAPRRARRKLSILLVLMFVAMVLAALAVWKFVLPKVVVQGTIRFDNAGVLRGEARDAFQKNQLDLLADERVRAAAEALFKTRKPTAAGFFVDQDFQHPQLKREWVTTNDRAELQITYQGSDPTLDPDRLSCLLQAIYDANSSSVSAAAAAIKTFDQKRMALSTARAELNKVRERRASLEAIVRPDAFELATAQAAVDKLDQAWTHALAARKAIAADVDRLGQPAESAAAGAASDGDSSLKLMSEKLTALNGHLAEAKSAAAKQASDARKSLNSSIDQFQTSLGVAQGMMKDNPALASYITSAQKLHEASWKLQGDLIERQERQQKQLLEYKKRLEEQVEVRKREVLEKDQDLKDLNHLLEMKRRELNALNATGGLKRDVEALRGDISILEGRILARTLAVSEDKFYRDAISGLKQIIDSVQGQLDADRGASEKLMNDLETRFRNTSPEIETLPSAQRTLAARLGEQANAMQNARKHYTEAVQSQDADANDRLKELQAQAAALESEIALRHKEVAAEQQKKLTEQQSAELEKKQAALAEAEKVERAARDAYRQKIKGLDLLVERDRAYQSTREELLRLAQVDEPIKQDQYNAAERASANAQRAVDSSIAPQPPSPPKILDMQDYRALFVTGAVLVVGLVFGSLIFFTAHADPRHRHAAHTSNQETPISA